MTFPPERQFRRKKVSNVDTSHDPPARQLMMACGDKATLAKRRRSATMKRSANAEAVP
jgi:hypothetical protein